MPNAENIEQRLITKVKNYLESKNVFYQKDFIQFYASRIVKMKEGDERDVYIVAYTVQVSDQKYDGSAIYFVYIDKNSEKLLYEIGPQSYSPIEGTW